MNDCLTLAQLMGFVIGFGLAMAAVRFFIRRREATGWRPISTAPKDGRPILLWIPANGPSQSGAGEQYDDTRYAIGYRRPPSWSSAKWPWGNRNQSEFTPTHWQPLPKPPETVEHGVQHDRR